MLRILSVMALIYGGAMVMLSVAVMFTFEPEKWASWNVAIPFILILAGIGQLAYTVNFQRSDGRVFTGTQTLDEAFTFGDERDEVVENGTWMVAVIALVSLIATGSLLYSISMFSVIFNNPALFLSGDRWIILVFVFVQVIFGLPAILYNVRTWNTKRIISRR